MLKLSSVSTLLHVHKIGSRFPKFEADLSYSLFNIYIRKTLDSERNAKIKHDESQPGAKSTPEYFLSEMMTLNHYNTWIIWTKASITVGYKISRQLVCPLT